VYMKGMRVEGGGRGYFHSLGVFRFRSLLRNLSLVVSGSRIVFCYFFCLLVLVSGVFVFASSSDVVVGVEPHLTLVCVCTASSSGRTASSCSASQSV
jgi:hypothetical protein